MANKANTEGMTVEDALDPNKALVPAVVRMNETRVRQGFWPKFARTAAKIPFARDVVSVWYCARDPATPVAAKGMMLAALAYFVLPTDAIPDVLAGIGFTDDAAVIAGVIALLRGNLKDRHRDQARAALDRLEAD
ncbi:YkvA family protein [Brevundimonas aveniformis]|uniref:YkvA family protein n=1 Tax=Brevundimonas aveniformis TaxID=370977 RepID=UPI002492CBDD|nr:YkvA family protein [Brevundimonas aveniformis]